MSKLIQPISNITNISNLDINVLILQENIQLKNRIQELTDKQITNCQLLEQRIADLGQRNLDNEKLKKENELLKQKLRELEKDLKLMYLQF